MSEKKKLVPKRRFKEFENADPWEQRKLGEVARIIMGQSPEGNTYSETASDFILVQGNADMQNGWVIPRVWTSQVTKKAAAGDLIMSVRAPAGSMGKTAFNVVIGRGVAAIKGNEFLYQLLVNLDSNGYWKTISTGSTFESLSSGDIINALIKIPKIEEQSKIGEFFYKLDNLITLHQRKLEKLKNLKSAYLSEMFPAEGERKPKRRFAGFTDDWEQRKLREIGTIMTGSTPSTANESYYNNSGIPWVTPTDISENITDSSEKRLSSDGEKVGVVVPKETILVTCIASIGKNTILGRKGSFNQQINGLIPNKALFNPYFLLMQSTLWSSKMKSIAASGTMQIINKTEFSNLLTYTPELNEQSKIGEFFYKLDNLITLHQRKLEKLQNIKKAYLNEMFI